MRLAIIIFDEIKIGCVSFIIYIPTRIYILLLLISQIWLPCRYAVVFCTERRQNLKEGERYGGG